MKHFLKQHTHLHGGAMETGDHSRNGASPKSRMSRGKHNLLKIVGNVIVLLLFTICSASAQQRHPGELEMVFVQGGTFTMGCTSEQGSDCFDDERPAHTVNLSNYYIGKYEVTQAQWKVVMGSNPSYFKGDNLPVENVSWNDVQEFIRKLNSQTGKNYRLPTEAEWEYAARGGNQSKGYKYSGSNSAGEVAWYYDNSGNKTHPVGQKKGNELGIYDMIGNVWEWCQDWDGTYSSNSQKNPVGASSGSRRVDRGGGWKHNAVRCRVAFRSSDSPSDRGSDLGFRLACSSK
jgi:formylglycine-generating enzyme required for sulfatase activity